MPVQYLPTIGINVIIFRGAERNRRRGFIIFRCCTTVYSTHCHYAQRNVMSEYRVPALRIRQGEERQPIALR